LKNPRRFETDALIYYRKHIDWFAFNFSMMLLHLDVFSREGMTGQGQIYEVFLAASRAVIILFLGFYRDERHDFVELKLSLVIIVFCVNMTVFLMSSLWNKPSKSTYALIFVDNILFFIQIVYYLIKRHQFIKSNR
jgi:hypothetical protein